MRSRRSASDVSGSCLPDSPASVWGKSGAARNEAEYTRHRSNGTWPIECQRVLEHLGTGRGHRAGCGLLREHSGSRGDKERWAVGRGGRQRGDDRPQRPGTRGHAGGGRPGVDVSARRGQPRRGGRRAQEQGRRVPGEISDHDWGRVATLESIRKHKTGGAPVRCSSSLGRDQKPAVEMGLTPTKVGLYRDTASALEQSRTRKSLG